MFMSSDHTAFWHKASFERFLNEYLPQLLAERIPLASYRVEAEHTYACRITIGVATENGELPLVYNAFPQPDAQGIFEIDGGRRVIFPIASDEALNTATIRCVGEQLQTYLAERLGHAPAHLPWDAALAQAWLPLHTWTHAFLTPADSDFAAQQSSAQWLDQSNWLAIHTNLRRLVVRAPQKLFAAGQLGRVCPFEIPEGPNMGRIFTIAVGAAIRDGRLVIEDEHPAATLGLSAALIPFLEHDDIPRLLMGTNMLRQWLVPPDPEPALVQTGHEPATPAIWNGRNLLTAFISWDGDTFEDGIVISESCARRLNYPQPIEPGDKLSNRHGAKGVISRILPDAQMPHLADGTAVELIFSVMSLPSRMNFGQVREATMSRIARAAGQPAIVPPFQAPGADRLREQLHAADLPDDGMEQLTLGPNQQALARRSTVGWVYWGKLHHRASEKLRIWTSQEQESNSSTTTRVGEPQSEPMYWALREAGAPHTILEQFNTRAVGQSATTTLAARLAVAPVEQAPPPTPMFAALQQRLRAGGIQAHFDGQQIAFQFAQPLAPALQLAQPVAHPWLPERSLDSIGVADELPAFAVLEKANHRLSRLLASHAPEPLIQQARSQLEEHVGMFFAALLQPEQLHFAQRAIFSARAVATPGTELSFDQVGLPEAMVWQLFEPMLARELGVALPIDRQPASTIAALDALLARTWVVVYSPIWVTAHGFLAFRPVRMAGHAIRLPLLACNLLNADFDGDQLSVFVPVTATGQHEAETKLTIAAHLDRDPALIEEVRPRMDALLALALHSRTTEGRAEIDALAGTHVSTPDGFVTRYTVASALQAIMERAGASAALAAGELLQRRGFELARGSGFSMSPFVGEQFTTPPAPSSADPDAWERYVQDIIERLRATRDYTSDFGTLVLAAKSGARTNVRQLAWTIGARGSVLGGDGQRTAIQHGHRDGLSLRELFALVPSTRANMHELITEWERLYQPTSSATHGYDVLARARRSPRPGTVFALAAAANEIDPLADEDSRLFVGVLPVEQQKSGSS